LLCGRSDRGKHSIVVPEHDLSKGHLFRVTRDADVEIRDDKAADLAGADQRVAARASFRFAGSAGSVVVDAGEMVEYLTKSLNLESDDVYKSMDCSMCRI
jgi:polyphosphate kinase